MLLLKKFQNMKTMMGIKLSEKSARKVDSYIEKYGEFEAYNDFGGRSIEEGIKNMIIFYKEYPTAPV